LLLSAIPAGLVGAVAEKKIDDKLGKPVLIAISLIFFGLLLGWADRRSGKRELDSFDTGDALKVGAAQILALNPGTSRSGITITALRWLGFNRDSAVRASFLMSVPVIAGAVVFKMAKLAKDGIPHGLAVPMLVGVITAAVSGYLAVWGLLKLVRTHSFMPFVVYRVAVGVLVLVVWFARR
jgi:undecaprenyl-diphosphatase